MFSVCSHLGGVHWPGPDAEDGTQPGLTGGVPHLRYPPPPLNLAGGCTPSQVPPHQVRPGWGVPHLTGCQVGSQVKKIGK